MQELRPLPQNSHLRTYREAAPKTPNSRSIISKPERHRPRFRPKPGSHSGHKTGTIFSVLVPKLVPYHCFGPETGVMTPVSVPEQVPILEPEMVSLGDISAKTWSCFGTKMRLEKRTQMAAGGSTTFVRFSSKVMGSSTRSLPCFAPCRPRQR